MDKRPQGRDKYVTNNGKGVHRRGEGLNTGPVGGQQARPGFGQGPRGGGGGNKGRPTRSGGGGLLGIIAAAVLLLGGGGLFGSGVLGGESAEPVYTQQPSSGYSSSYTTPSSGGTSSYSDYSSALESIFGSASTGSDPYASLFGGGTSSGGGSTSSSSSAGSSYVNTNTGAVDNDVAAGSRAKRTVIKGKGKDTVTVMVYMCGTDLESRSAMGTKDIIEMTKARLSDNVNVIIYTGGCARWNNQVMSNKVNQIYKVENGQLNRLVSDAGNVSMTSPATLTSFIQWCDKNYPANRNELILWDHGGGSVSGYGYDEKYQRSGSMTLAGINTALSDAGVSFDFIGFDACLMATVETGLMLDQYADYMIASEETEPGIGWYYTNWLTKLSADTSMPTTEIGKNIVDDFVSTCQSQTRGQSATLSVVDLAELAHTVPAPMKAFSKSISSLVNNNAYKQVSTARNNTREFARSTMIDQIDLVHFAKTSAPRRARRWPRPCRAPSNTTARAPTCRTATACPSTSRTARPAAWTRPSRPTTPSASTPATPSASATLRAWRSADRRPPAAPATPTPLSSAASTAPVRAPATARARVTDTAPAPARPTPPMTART